MGLISVYTRPETDKELEKLKKKNVNISELFQKAVKREATILTGEATLREQLDAIEDDISLMKDDKRNIESLILQKTKDAHVIQDKIIAEQEEDRLKEEEKEKLKQKKQEEEDVKLLKYLEVPEIKAEIDKMRENSDLLKDNAYIIDIMSKFDKLGFQLGSKQIKRLVIDLAVSS